MVYSGILFGVTIVLINLCICQTQAEGGVFSVGLGASKSDAMYQREILDIKAGLATYDVTEAYPDDEETWKKLISKDIAANIGKLLENSDDEPIRFAKKRAVIGFTDRPVQRSSACDDAGDCSPRESMSSIFGLSDDEEYETISDDGISVASELSREKLIPRESGEIHLAMTLSAAAYMSDEEISAIPELVGSQVDEFPMSYRHSTRTVGGNEPTLFRVWRFKENGSTLYVSFLGIVDRAVHFSDIDTQMSPLSQSVFVPSSPSKRRFDQVSVSRVHRGFLHLFLMIEEQLRESLEQSTFSDEIDRIVFTGHSIGGAIAAIAATVTRHFYSDVDIDVITFGSPRVGDHRFVEEFSTSVSFSLRVVLHDDVVPILYPISDSFQHVPEFLCIDCDGADSTEISSVSRIKTALNTIGHNIMKRHSVGNYLRALETRFQESATE